MLKKCVSITPPNYLQVLCSNSLKADDSVVCPAPNKLGDGELADEYEEMMAKRRAEDAEQIARDIQLAKQLSALEETQVARVTENVSSLDEVFGLLGPSTSQPPGGAAVAHDGSRAGGSVHLCPSAPIVNSPPSVAPTPVSDGWITKATARRQTRPKPHTVVTTRPAPLFPPSSAAKKTSLSSAGNRTATAAAVDIRSFLAPPLGQTPSHSHRHSQAHVSGGEHLDIAPVVGHKHGLDSNAQSSLASNASRKHRQSSAVSCTSSHSDGTSGPSFQGAESVIELPDETSNASSISPPEWSCPVCTFWNCGHLSICEMCQSAPCINID